MNKTLFIKSYGCQMNVYDADRMTDLLEDCGCKVSEDISDADIIILNTCHIREKATEKIYSELGRLSLEKEKRKVIGKQTILAVGGCVGQAEGSEIIRRAPQVDLVFGPQSYHKLPEMISKIIKSNEKVIDTSFPVESKYDSLLEHKTGKQYAAFITVQEGCDKFCSFCVVPYTRGSEFSRPVRQVLAEASGLLKKGIREITLLGQNVNNYHGKTDSGEEWGLGQLIRALSDLDGLSRIRYTTSYPADLKHDLIDAHRDVEALMPFLHLPIQSGSNKILRAMNRRHNVEDYLDKVNCLRSARPDIAFSSDFIVGFPGETDEDFEKTIEVIEKVKFINAYSFKFSARPGTPATSLENQISEDVKSDRLQRLQKLLALQQYEFNKNCVGKTLPILLEKEADEGGNLIGRSPFMQVVHVEESKEYLGEIKDFKISAAHKRSLFGALVNP